MAENEPPSNIFRRFKYHVDTHVATAFQGLIGLPSVVSRNFNGRLPPPAEPSTFRSSGGDSNVNDQGPERELSDDYSESLNDLVSHVYWLSFAMDSPYSPLNLRHMPQPVPLDLPADADPGLFSFEDAFEDLITVSKGQNMQDINSKFRMKRGLAKTFPAGEPPVEWLHRLRRRGLLDGWDPRPIVNGVLASQRWPQLSYEQGLPRSWTHQFGSVFEEYDRIFRELHQAAGISSTIPEHTEAEPETTEELLLGILGRSFSQEQDWPLIGMLRRAIADQPDVLNTPSKSLANDIFSTKPVPGARVVEKSAEEEDENGNKIITRTKITFNEMGEEVGRETQYQVLYKVDRQVPSRKPTAAGRMDESTTTEQETGSGNQNPGWFWK